VRLRVRNLSEYCRLHSASNRFFPAIRSSTSQTRWGTSLYKPDLGLVEAVGNPSMVI
jgi:hypothetical protein